MKQLELLAPAKDLECGITAIKCGADAVYIGAGKFGARVSAGNDLQDIEALIKFAHFYRVKVYVTVNTIFYDKEIEQAQKLIQKLYQIGTDAIIIQDMGLLELDLPPIQIFASTQCHNNCAEKVKFLEKVGFSRVILARELSLEQIKEIRSQTEIELEAFIHGALCVSYSGQCYMSYAIGGRSGNRGECAQPCRKLYSLIDSTGKIISDKKYLLCLKDLNLSNNIKDLIDAGITSFKIEGRLKDANYIKNIVTFYRNAIDKAIEGTEYKKSSSGLTFADFVPDPLKTFNRDYSDYFLKRRKKEISSFDTPKFKGEYIGKVSKVFKDYFIIDKSPKVNLNNGDGISFFDPKGQLCGTVVNSSEGNRIYPNSIESVQSNTAIYRNFDHEFIKKLKNAEVKRKIFVNFKFYESTDGFILHAVDEDGIEASASFCTEKEPAKNPEMALENIKKQIQKLGETDFISSDIEIDIKSTYFIRVKDLNELRRAVIEKLMQNRKNSYKRVSKEIISNNYPYPESELSFEGNVLNDYARKFYIRHGLKTVESAAESGLPMQSRKVMTTKHCLKYQFNLCSKQNRKHKYKEPFYLLDEQNKKYLLKFNCKKCEMEIYY